MVSDARDETSRQGGWVLSSGVQSRRTASSIFAHDRARTGEFAPGVLAKDTAAAEGCRKLCEARAGAPPAGGKKK